MLWSRFKVPVGWGEIFRRTGRAIYSDDCFGWSAQLAYYFFVALFPALLFLVSLAGYLPVHDLIESITSALARVAPGELVAIVRDQLVQIAHSQHGGVLTVGILGTIWSTSSGMSAVIDTLNQAYHVREGRPWWRVKLLAVALTVALAVFVIVSFALIMIGPALAQHLADRLWMGPAFTLAWNLVQWPVVFALVVTAVALVFYYAPDVRQEWVWITPGSVTATILWILISVGFRWYVTHLASYQKTYGAIGGVLVALLWLYFSGLTLLLGAELNAAIEHASIYGKDPGEKVPHKPPVPPTDAAA